MTRKSPPMPVVTAVQRTAVALWRRRSKYTTRHIVKALTMRRPLLNPVTMTGKRGWLGGGQKGTEARVTTKALSSPAKSITSDPVKISTPRVGVHAHRRYQLTRPGAAERRTVPQFGNRMKWFRRSQRILPY